MKLGQILALRALDNGHYLGEGPKYAWGGLYGGQLIAQAIMAVGDSVAENRWVHSLHAHFIRRGENGCPVEYRVESERDGGSYSTRLVHAYQGDRRLLAATVSFTTVFEPHGRRSRDLAAVDGPQNLHKSSDWFTQFERRGLPEASQGRMSSAAWFRSCDEIPTDSIYAAAALAYMSDDLPTETVMLAEPEPPASIDEVFSASLDHSIWFHGVCQPQEWQFMEFQTLARNVDRGLAQGQAFDAEGRLLATIAQEVLLRHRHEM